LHTPAHAIVSKDNTLNLQLQRVETQQAPHTLGLKLSRHHCAPPHVVDMDGIYFTLTDIASVPNENDVLYK